MTDDNILITPKERALSIYRMMYANQLRQAFNTLLTRTEASLEALQDPDSSTISRCLQNLENAVGYLQKWDIILTPKDQFPVQYNGPYSTFREAIKDFRKQCEFTQEQLANKSGVAIRTINSLEQGKYQITRKTYDKLLRIFDISPPKALSSLEQLACLKK